MKNSSYKAKGAVIISGKEEAASGWLTANSLIDVAKEVSSLPPSLPPSPMCDGACYNNIIGSGGVDDSGISGPGWGLG